MYQLKPGWTKDRMLTVLVTGNKGTKAASIEGMTSICLYLTAEGNRCAVGCFIPDGHPGQGCRGGVDTLLRAYPDLRDAMPLDDIGMGQLQFLHDKCETDLHTVFRKFLDEQVEEPCTS